MRITSSTSLRAGMKLGKTIYAPKGGILLQSGVVLTNSYIASLIQKNIPAVYIDDEISEGIELWDAIDVEVKAKAIFSIKSIFDDMCHGDKRRKKSNSSLPLVSSEHYTAVKTVLGNLIDNLTQNQGCLMNMVEVMSSDLYTYTHSVNVAILTILTCRSLQMSKKMEMELGMGALLHDVGKIAIPDEILNKSTELTPQEREIMEQHSTLGYEMLRNNYDVSAYTKSIVLLHHERLDGSGYPSGIKQDKIHPFVRLVSICDSFDAMVSDRCYREKMPVYKVLEIINAQLGVSLDYGIYQKFIQNVSIFPAGTSVRLSTGETALVVGITDLLQPTRPKVRLIHNPKGQAYDEIRIIDLMKELTVFIEDTCDL